MIHLRLLRRVGPALILAAAALMLLRFALSPGQVTAGDDTQPRIVFTPTYTVHLPLISREIACANPPSGTMMIGGRATVAGQSAGSGIPFRLLYSAHWDTRAYYVLTATTHSNGDFCFGPVELLKYRGSWYKVVFRSEWISEEAYVSWSSPMLRDSEVTAGEVYTFVAEIGP
jgi:hypothetical protein